MNTLTNELKTLGRMAICALSILTFSGIVNAQSANLSAEEIEQLVKEQKAALEEVIANRSKTETMAEQLREELANTEALKEQARQELEALCREQEELKADSYEECVK